MSEYRKAIKRMDVCTGDSVRILRELQEMSQNDLAAVMGIAQSTISAIEKDRIRQGVDRAKMLAKALRCLPPCLYFQVGMLRGRHQLVRREGPPSRRRVSAIRRSRLDPGSRANSGLYLLYRFVPMGQQAELRAGSTLKVQPMVMELRNAG